MDAPTLNITSWVLLIMAFATPLFEKDEERRHLISFMLSTLALITCVVTLLSQ